jgi:RimJ/RimL family protein N-acetyltransferase
MARAEASGISGKSNKTMKYLFYTRDPSEESIPPAALPGSYRVEVWRPTLGSIKARGLSMMPFGVWWLFHQSRIFYNRDYGLIVIYDGDRLINRICVFPGYFRFPFMSREDLQIGDTWTADDHRGQGLAPWAIRKAFEAFNRKDRRFWYITAQTNTASIRAAEKAGFKFRGEGSRVPRFGLKPLGAYVLDA